MGLRRWNLPAAGQVFGAALLVCAAAYAQPQPPGAPLPGLTADELAAFLDGRQAFGQPFAPPDGLGPVFNDNSCVACHGPVPGAGAPRVVTRFGRKKGKSFDPLGELGGSLIQARAIRPPGCEFEPEVVPRQANVVVERRTQPLFGLGLVDAVPDVAFEALAAEQAALSRKTAGRPNYVTQAATGLTRVGRFGWKAQVATLEDFSGDAMLNEIGLTNPLFPEESCPQGDCDRLVCNPVPALNDDGTLVERLTAFQLLLAPPPRGPAGPAAQRGEAVFEELGCGSCHVSTLVTGSHEVAALDRVEFHPYSDFLLHDMGKLGDTIEQGQATGREMRTAPLWGVGRQPRLLHDGRAASIDEAILEHEGQAAATRRAYGKLGSSERDDLLAFLRSL